MSGRRHTRIKHTVPVEVRVERGRDWPLEYEGQLADISVMGLAVTLPGSPEEPVRAGCPARISILKSEAGAQAPDSSIDMVLAEGSVLRSARQPDGTHLIAIRFSRAYYDAVAGTTEHQRVFVDLLARVKEVGAEFSPSLKEADKQSDSLHPGSMPTRVMPGPV